MPKDDAPPIPGRKRVDRRPDLRFHNGSSLLGRLFVLYHNLDRRPLTSGQRAAYATDVEEWLAARAKERQRAAGGDRKSSQAKTGSVRERIPQAIEPKARDLAAQLADTNPRYIQDALAVKAADPALLAKVRAGAITLPRARRQVARARKRADLEAKAASGLPGRDSSPRRARKVRSTAPGGRKSRHGPPGPLGPLPGSPVVADPPIRPLLEEDWELLESLIREATPEQQHRCEATIYRLTRPPCPHCGGFVKTDSRGRKGGSVCYRKCKKCGRKSPKVFWPIPPIRPLPEEELGLLMSLIRGATPMQQQRCLVAIFGHTRPPCPHCGGPTDIGSGTPEGSDVRYLKCTVSECGRPSSRTLHPSVIRAIAALDD